MGMTVLQKTFKDVEDHSDEGKSIAKTIHVLYENSLRGDLTALGALKNYKYDGRDQELKVKITDLVLLASSVGASQ